MVGKKTKESEQLFLNSKLHLSVLEYIRLHHQEHNMLIK